MDVGTAFAADSAHDKTGILGFFLGGDIAWAGAADYRLDAAVCYYGGRIADMLDQTNNCPVMMHHGTDDPWLPPENLQKIAAPGKPDLIIHDYECVGHAFNNETLAHRYVPGAGPFGGDFLRVCWSPDRAGVNQSPKGAICYGRDH